MLLCVSCGRKQKHIFYFSDEKPLPKVSKLSLPVVKGLTVRKDGASCTLSWFALHSEHSDDISNDKLVFLGYNVYRLVNAYFIPKKPLNEKIITQETFIDTSIYETEHLKKQEQYCYLVCAVFTFYNQTIESPSSQVVCVKNFPPT
jgi:hypothetical protein